MENRDLIDFMEQFDDTVEVTILEDNKYIIEEYVMLGSDLIADMTRRNLKYDGFGSSEFYIVKDNGEEFTVQVSNFQLDSNCEF